MKTITLNNTNLNIPEIGMGCMRINGLETVDHSYEKNTKNRHGCPYHKLHIMRNGTNNR